MQVDPRDLDIVLGLARRAPKTAGEARLLELLVAQWNAQVAEAQKPEGIKDADNNIQPGRT